MSRSFLRAVPRRGRFLLAVVIGAMLLPAAVLAATLSGAEENNESHPSALAAAGPCPDVSPLACDQVKANLPLTLGFDADHGGLLDGGGEGTGFTMVQRSSNGGQYLPAQLDLDRGAGKLRINSTAGIQYRTQYQSPAATNPNTLDNGLGVGLDATKKLRLETTVLNTPVPSGSSQSQQSGLWFGPNEDNYVKLVVTGIAGGHKIQLVREVEGFFGATEEVNSLSLGNLSTQTVRLSLLTDPASGEISALYKLGSGAETVLGKLTVPANFFNGSYPGANTATVKQPAFPAGALEFGSTGFGGIFATHRNGPATLPFDFGEFTVADMTPAASPNMEVTPDRFVLNQPTGDGAGPAKTVTIHNTGDGPLHMGQMRLEGAGASQFTIVDQPDATVAPNGSTTAQVAFDPSSAGLALSDVVVPGDDPDAPVARVQLRGLGTAGTGGSNEPSLQRVLDVHGITVNVGDDDPNTNVFHSSVATQKAQLVGPDEVRVQRFEKAGSGPVTVETLAVFGPTDANPVVRVGRHLPGDAAQKTELLSVPNAPTRNGQTVDVPNGTTSFDPADNPFAFYSEWPFFQNRLLSQEDARNTFSGAFPHHVRVYPYRTAAGATPNAYVLATEEVTSNGDFQDVVLLVRNVRPSGGEIAVENMDGVPFADRLVFNRIQTPDAANPNGVHDQATLRIRNTSAVEPLTVTGLDLPTGFELVNPPALPRAIPANGSVDVIVKFTATTPAGNPANRLFEGNLTVRSSDADQPATPIELAGMWQRQSEGGTEPDVAQIADAFGYGTTIVNSGQTLNSAGELVKVGDEVHSKYWRRGDTTQPVKVRQLAAFHTQGNTATFFTTLKATSTTPPASTTRLVHRGVDGQSFLPRMQGTTCPTSGTAGPNERAECSFTPNNTQTGTTSGNDADDGVFGFRIDPEYSDWTVNRTGGGIDGPCLERQQTNPGVVCGHHLRTWPVKDRAGKLVKDKWLAVMDYAGINYDFNDNVYLVENVKPEDPAVDPNVLQPCTPITCDKVKVGLPFDLDFGAARAETVEDKDGQGTGFTWVDRPTNTSTGAKGYIKENLDLDGGALRITTTKGLQFSGTTNNPDSQDNMLGAGIDWGTAPKPASIGTTLLAPPVGSANFEQAGLWFGRDGDSYVKLVLISDTDGPRVQFLKEQERQHDSTNDQCKSDVLALAGKDLQLKVDADPVTRRVTASYRLAGGSETALPCSFTVPGSWFSQDSATIDERIGTSSFAGVFASHRNAAAPLTYSFGDFAVREQASRPRVTAMRPADGATDVIRDVAIATDLQLPNGSIDNATVTAQSVRLVKASDGQPVAGTRGTSGGGDTVTFTPSGDLDANTAYRFEVSDQLRDLSGASFLPFTGTFTTGERRSDDGSGSSSAAFTKVTLPTATAPQYHGFTSLAFGPDGKLYGARNDGQIRRWAVNSDGTLGTPEELNALTQAEGGSRLLIGMRFDPSSTPSNPIAWVSHTTYGFDGMPDWGGKITRLSGANLQNVQDYVVGLPRSARDHVTNGIDIGPDGALYFTQGSNSAMGREDSSWGNRPERLLNAAVLRLDPTKVTGGPVNVKTEEGGSYNPFAAGTPLTIWASGVRNAYDLAWHSNGELYVPTNGSAAGGNTPSTPSPLPASCQKRLNGGTFTGPSAPALTGVSQTQHDFLFRAVQGGYYGHPNPTRCEWTLNGGNPTSASDPGQVDAYPVGTQPDPNWRGAAFDFGLNKSPNGLIEYRNASVFGGSLAGKLLVLRYSNNDDVIALTPGGQNKDIVAEQTGIPGTSGFKDPLDIVEQPGTGNLYVSEYDQLGSGPKITLLKVNDSSQPQPCSPVSTLPCPAVKVALPRFLNWSSDHGGLADKDGQGTGFTMVQPSSNGGAFKPELLDADPATGRFTITTTKGIQYKQPTGTPPSSNNNLDNGLGVGLSDTQPLRFETTLAGFPNASGQSEQAGLWFGPGEDDYVKLVVASTGPDAQRVQLMREVGGASIVDDEVNLPLPANIEGSEAIRLRLEVDPAGTARGWYALGSGALQELPSQLVVPPSFFDGSKVADSLEAKGLENFGGVFATHRNSTTAGAGLRFTFDDFAVEQNRGPNREPVVEAIADRTSLEGELADVRPQATDADGDTLTWTATGLPAGLTINPATGAIGGTIASGAARMEPYAVTITVSDGFGGQASKSFAWTVTAETLPTVDQLKVNFQSAAAAIPDGYVRDYGLPYGPRSATDQDGTGRATLAAQAGLRYGWVDPSTANPRDLSVGGSTPGNGRDRNVLSDQRYDTLMHMQGNHVPEFNGTPLPGSWEVALPDGSYDVTVAAGDPSVGADPERHALSVEGEPALDFAPSGAAGAETRRQTATIHDVEVGDGRLTLLATGQNTKVNFIEIDRSEPSNEPPVVSVIADKTHNEGDEVELDVVGSDPENGTLSWSATGLPAGLEIDPDTGDISGTIAAGAADDSPYTVTVTATDDGTPKAKTDVSFKWTVVDATAPGPVTGLRAELGDRQVELSWTNPGGDFAAVRVLRTTGAPASGPNDADAVEVYEGNNTTATAGGLANGTAYTFTVFARDEANNWSEARTVTATPVAPPVDPKPTQPSQPGNPTPTQPTAPTQPPVAGNGQPQPSRARATVRLAPGAALARQPVVAARLRGRLTGATAGRHKITIECARTSGGWKKVAKALTTRDGRFSVRLRRLERSIRCRARFAGDSSTRPAVSAPRRVASIASARAAHKK